MTATAQRNDLYDPRIACSGVGLYPTGALVNHSRDFNAVQSFDGAVIRFAAVRPITAGEEVTISYLDLKCSRPGAVASPRHLLHL